MTCTILNNGFEEILETKGSNAMGIIQELINFLRNSPNQSGESDNDQIINDLIKYQADNAKSLKKNNIISLEIIFKTFSIRLKIK